LRSRAELFGQVVVGRWVFRVLVGEGEAAEREFDEGDAERPDVGFYGVVAALDSLRLWRQTSVCNVQPGPCSDEVLTLIYVDVPTNVFAMELISSPETPKSQILIAPLELTRMFDGLISWRVP
jgi:hypothetical protein